MKYLSGEPFSVGGGGKAYEDGWERTFGKKEPAAMIADDQQHMYELGLNPAVFYEAAGTEIDIKKIEIRTGCNQDPNRVARQTMELLKEVCRKPRAVDDAHVVDFTEAKSKWNTTAIHDQVREFRTAMGFPNPQVPAAPGKERVKLALSLILEEFLELVGACTGRTREDVKKFAEHAVGQLNAAYIDVDLVEVADALADIDYVVEGMRQELGINGKPVADEVHRSNMAKLGGGTREDGKQLKPEGWTPPNIEGELIKQGMA